ncbi:YlxR family protein [Clostridium sp. BNL1100]|uniref:RNase P modulator RnpM n=1 Tax=Clostridium sp. BNL1100 TaxID=755731 RepID=UPI00024A7929|nr:YlxR family protein [Clostridium sp. BNL1100]AEY65685.1 putative nucleic-acid-binding protein implicated in transcription termination [Clostridium sp. BNL1100]
MKQKKIPLRMCLGCKEMKPKRELIRVVKNNEGEISIDLVGKKPGRGAYICRSADCLEQAIKAKRLEKAFETTIDMDIYHILKNQLEENDG